MGTVTRVDYLTNRAYGFPVRGVPRRFPPKVAAVVHITGNAKNFGPGIDYAQRERNYANRAGSPGPSAHWYLARDGSAVHAIDERRFAAWSNGDLDHPDRLNAGVRYLVDLKARGYNANEGCGVEIENVGIASAQGQPTAAQFARMADIIADACRFWQLEPTRSTILTHADINSIDRQNCAFLARTREAQMDRLIGLVAERVGTVANVEFTIVGNAAGNIQVVEDGVQAIRLRDGARIPLTKGTRKEAIARIHLMKPIDSAAGNRSDGYLVGDDPALLLSQNVAPVPF